MPSMTNNGSHSMVVDMPEIVINRVGPFKTQICTSIPPAKKDTINIALIRDNLNYSGTLDGWHLDNDTAPVPCASYPGRWHYLCDC